MLIKYDPSSPRSEDVRTISIHPSTNTVSMALLWGITVTVTPAISPLKLTRLSGGCLTSPVKAITRPSMEPTGAVKDEPFSGGKVMLSDLDPFQANTGTCCQV